MASLKRLLNVLLIELLGLFDSKSDFLGSFFIFGHSTIRHETGIIAKSLKIAGPAAEGHGQELDMSVCSILGQIPQQRDFLQIVFLQSQDRLVMYRLRR